MFCAKCGTELPEVAKFCTHCGTPVKISPALAGTESMPTEENTTSAVAEPTMKPVKQRRSLNESATDFIASKISGKEIKTINVSMEDMIALLTKHFINVTKTDKERKKLRRILIGSVTGGTSNDVVSADGKYMLWSNASSIPGMQQLQGRLRNSVSVKEFETDKVFKYESAGWGNFKNAVTAVMDEAWK